MTDPYRALCEQLMELVEGKRYDGSAVILRARAALLAQPEPVAPTDEDLMAAARKAIDTYPRGSELPYFLHEDSSEYEPMLLALRSAACWGTPAIQPVPVSERLPGPDDCNDEGYCWWWRTDEVDEWWEFMYLRDVRDHNRRCGSAQYTHWLPYHAIPNLPNPND